MYVELKSSPSTEERLARETRISRCGILTGRYTYDVCPEDHATTKPSASVTPYSYIITGPDRSFQSHRCGRWFVKSLLALCHGI